MSDLWREHQYATFPPSCRDTPLLRLDAELGRVLTACLRRDGVARPLSTEQRAVVERGRAELEAALAGPMPPDGRVYFERLLKIAGSL